MRTVRFVCMAVFLVCPAALALTDVANQRVSKQAPPQSGCVVPSPDTAFSPSDAIVYLYFEATESSSDHVTNDWLAPDGTIINGGTWSSSSGRYCFTGASLGISNTPANRFGSWQARVLNSGAVVFSVPFTITNSSSGSGAPAISDANPKTIPIGVNTTITLTGTGVQSGFSGKLWVGNTSWPINSGSQTIFDSASQVRLVVQVGQPNDATTTFGLQIINPDGQPSNVFGGLTAMQNSTGGGGGGGQRMTSGWYWPTGSSDFCGYLGWLGYNSAETNPYHLAQDMCNRQGNPVYAIGPGSIIYSRTDVGGYGRNYTKGGALVARHQAADGSWFTALYGHLDNPHDVGNVAAGDVIGYTNDFSPSHLHFGIHPGFDPEPNDPWRGYSGSTTNTYGFTDPIPFLNAHPLNVVGGGVGGSYPESAHPYSDNLDFTWTYSLPGGASGISVTFDSQTKVEEGYDYLYVTDGNGNNIAGSPFTGTSLAGRTVTLPGSTVKIRLKSDYSVVYYGFRVTNVVATSGGGNGGNGGLYQPGDGASDSNPWLQAFYRNQFNTYSVLPTDNPVSPLGPGCIQYFKATDTQQKTEVLMQRNCTGTVYQIYGGMSNKYTSDGRLGGPTGSIGYPTNDRQNGRSSVDGQTFEWQEFQTTGGANTRIVQYNGNAYAVFAGILSYWASQGYENSRLGIPTSEEFDWGSNGCKRQNFQNGWYVWWSPVPGGTCNGN